MKRLLVLLLIALLLVTAVSAQDWRYDADTEFNINCTVVDKLHQEFGDEPLMMRDDSFFISLSELLDTLYPVCLAEVEEDTIMPDSSETADESEASPAEESEEATVASAAGASADEIEVTAVLENSQMHSLFDVDCGVMVADRFDEDFNVAITGERQSSASVDVYLPGETEPLDLEHVHRYSVNVRGTDVPTRTEWAVRESFPMGLYTFDVHVDDQSYRFQWEREDEAFNTLVLTCLDSIDEAEPADAETAAAEDDAADSAAAATDAESEIVRLENDKIHTIEPEGCVVAVDTRFEDDFNVNIAGNNQDGLAVDVYLPGESEPLVMDDSHSYSVDIGGPLPVRTEWAVGDEFPMGLYSFVAHIDDNVYRFEWDRQDEAYRTFVLTCYRESLEDVTSEALTDGELRRIPDTDCFVWTEAWDEDFNIIILGEDQDGMAVEVYFPGEIQPESMDDVSTGELDNGTPYRIEWIAGRFFPLGLYNFDVVIGDENHQFKWQREDEEHNSFALECESEEEE